MILRRGPTRQVCLVGWDLGNDVFDVGQWFKGRVYPERCDLSPDGRWMLAFMASHRPPHETWTVLCHPPFFTAVALWPLGGTYGGGGRFLGDRSLTLFHGSTIPALADGFPQPSGFDVVPYTAATMDRLGDRDFGHPGGSGTILRQGPRGMGLTLLGGVYALGKPGAETPLDGVSWADFDARGDLVLTHGGTVRRVRASRIPVRPSTESVLDASRLLVDLSDLRFRPLEASYASPRVSGASVPYEPRIDRTTREDRRTRLRERRAAGRVG